jgi:hypothetical protein
VNEAFETAARQALPGVGRDGLVAPSVLEPSIGNVNCPALAGLFLKPDRHEMATRKQGISDEQRRALRLLVRNSNGHTEAIMLAHGFTIAMLAVLVRDGLASARPETVRAGKRPIKVTRVRITDAGRQALAE